MAGLQNCIFCRGRGGVDGRAWGALQALSVQLCFEYWLVLAVEESRDLIVSSFAGLLYSVLSRGRVIFQSHSLLTVFWG